MCSAFPASGPKGSPAVREITQSATMPLLSATPATTASSDGAAISQIAQTSCARPEATMNPPAGAHSIRWGRAAAK